MAEDRAEAKRLCGVHDLDDDARLVPVVGRGRPPELAVLIHGQFRGMMLSGAFPCLGGTSAIRRGSYRFGIYPALGSSDAVAATAVDLAQFAADRPASEHPVAVFVSAYDGPAIGTEEEFERALWEQLHGLAAMDKCPPLDRGELVDPDDPGFVYAGREFFIVGLHPASSRWARRFGWPLLVFNALSHSVPLRQTGKYERMHDRIIERDSRLQGCENPSLDAPQLAQFSGRAVDGSWSCLADRGQGHT